MLSKRVIDAIPKNPLLIQRIPLEKIPFIDREAPVPHLEGHQIKAIPDDAEALIQTIPNAENP